MTGFYSGSIAEGHQPGSSCYGQLTGAMRPWSTDRGNVLRRTSHRTRGSVTVLRRVITTGVAVAGATALFASAASASVPPVNYSLTRTGPGGTITGTVKCEYRLLESYSPINVYDYPGTAHTAWVSQPEEWNGSRWVLLNPREGFFATGLHGRVGNWWFFPTSRGWINPVNGRPAPAQWSVVHGHYYAAFDTTLWYNSAGRLEHRYLNRTNYCEA